MEALPDELLLLIFRYLHKFDILYSFDNLNQRFQNILTPYLYDIDFANENTLLPYKRFSYFLHKILPIHGQHICSLKLRSGQQSQLFYQRMSYLTKLKSLAFTSAESYRWFHTDEIYQHLSQTLQMKSLTEFTISVFRSKPLQTISRSATQNLTTLALLHADGALNFDNVSKMPYVKCLTVDLQSLEQVLKVFEIMPGLEEVRLTIYTLDDVHLPQVPQNLEKLHLEIGSSSEYDNYVPELKHLKMFFDRFPNEQLKSFSLIVNRANADFSNFEKFQNLLNNFTRLQTLEYYIHTKHQPDSRFSNVEQLPDSRYCFYTHPRPQSSSTITAAYQRPIPKLYLDSSVTLTKLLPYQRLAVYGNITVPTLELKNNNIQLLNLKEIRIEWKIECLNASIYHFLSNVIRLSPKLDTVYIKSGSTKKIIGHLKNLLRKKFERSLNLECSLKSTYIGDYHKEFFQDLSKLLPNLMSLSFPCVEQFIDEYPIALSSLLEDLRSYFPKITRLKLEFDRRYQDSQKTLENYKNELDEIQHTVGYTVITSGSTQFLTIWL